MKAEREITIHDLLTHSSGISYRLMNKPFLGKMYADAGVVDGLSETPGTIGDNVKKLAKLPLACQPGAAWEYGLNTDVLGHVVEVVSGKSLEEFFRERIFKPLKMNDTYFVLPKEKHSRLCALYSVGPDKPIARVGNEPVTTGAAVFYGHVPDARRQQVLLRRRGPGLDGRRLLPLLPDDAQSRRAGRRPRAQGRNRRPDDAEPARRAADPVPRQRLMGYGFGVLTEKGKEKTKDPAGVGTYAWGGAFDTFFWVDPKNELIGVFMTQVFPPDFVLPRA